MSVAQLTIDHSVLAYRIVDQFGAESHLNDLSLFFYHFFIGIGGVPLGTPSVSLLLK
jgi:hypothetical protein